MIVLVYLVVEFQSLVARIWGGMISLLERP